MNMDLLPYVVAYIAMGIFVVAVIARFLMWSRLPMHLRWELYPVAHEGKRAAYGGSYLEEVDWWKKPRETSLWNELKAMAAEILFLVALKENNPKLWIRSFPFHFGLYLVIGCTVLMFGNGLLAAVAPSIVAGVLGKLLQYLIIACGVAGLVLGLLGALGLLQRRLLDPELRDFTAPADIVNLVFFVVAFGCALLSFALVDRDFSRAMFFAGSLVTFKMVGIPGTGLEILLPTASVVLLAALTDYIPLTHMSHFVGKFFAYHAIRWNDTPNLRGGEQEPKIQEVLSYKISWAASHIAGEGKKTWVDAATEEVKK
jgi:nitrate reductase gamma subunit